MNKKMKKVLGLGIVGLALLALGIIGVNNHLDNASDVMEAKMVDEDVFSEEDYARFAFFNNIQEGERQRLMNDKHQLEQERVEKNEADRQAEIKRLAEEARLEEEKRIAEENRIKEAERVAQAEREAQAKREAQAQTTTASNSSSKGSSQTSTQSATTKKSTPAPKQPAPKPAPAKKPAIGPNKIGINGVYRSYMNYGAADITNVQRGIDKGYIVAALTYFNPGDGQTTYFGGHNPGVMNFMAANMHHGAIVTVTDSKGNPFRYKMVDHVNTDTSGSAVFESIGHAAVSVYAYGSNEESILIQFCNTNNSLMSLWYGVPVN